MTVIIHSELLTAVLPCGVYYYGGIYRAWYLGAPGSKDLPSHILWNIDDSDPLIVYGEVTVFGSGDTFGPVPESEIELEFEFTPPSPGTYTGEFTTDSDASVEDTILLEGVSGSAEHTITYSAGPGGSISGTTPQTVEDGGDGTPVTAVPDPGYRFVEWSDSGTTPERVELNVTSDLTVTAVFIRQYTVSYRISPAAAGSISGAADQTVDEGSDCTAVTAVPEMYYVFAGWDDSHPDPERHDMGIMSDAVYTALFTPVEGIYLKQDASGDETGLDWDNAFTDMETAFSTALQYGIANIRAAQGTYLPYSTNSLPAGVRFLNFRLYNGVTLIGGYKAESGTDLTRDIDLYKSIMSGAFPKYNVYHTMYLDAVYGLDETAVLDGFYISGGDASGFQGLPIHSCGGGILCKPGNHPSFMNCRITGNKARSGAGVALLDETRTCPPSGAPDYEDLEDTAPPVFTDCIISDNEAEHAGGGVLFKTVSLTSSAFSGTVIRDNSAVYGAGLAVINSTGTLCYGPKLSPSGSPALEISGNTASRGGGGMYILYPGTKAVMVSVLIEGNTSKLFGGGLLISGGTFGLNNAVVCGNGSRIGGGMFLESCNYSIHSFLCVGNRASTKGGALYTIPYEGTIDRSIFEDNAVSGLRPEKKGGAVYALNGRLNILNSIFYRNSSDYRGGALYTLNHQLFGAGLTILDNQAEDGGFAFLERTRAHLNAVILRTSEEEKTGQISGDKYRTEIRHICRDEDTSYENITGENITDDPELTITEVSVPWTENHKVHIPVPAGTSPCIGLSELSLFEIYLNYSAETKLFRRDFSDAVRSDPTTLGALEP